MAGNGTIGLELLEDLPGLRTRSLVPFGGGGLSDRDRERGQGAAARRPRVYAVEPETGAPLDGDASRRASRRPVEYQAVVRRRLGRAGAAAGDVGAACASCSTARSRSPSTRPPTAVRAARRARARDRGGRGRAGGRGGAPAGRVEASSVVCIVSGGNIDAGEARADPGRRDALAGTGSGGAAGAGEVRGRVLDAVRARVGADERHAEAGERRAGVGAVQRVLLLELGLSLFERHAVCRRLRLVDRLRLLLPARSRTAARSASRR